MKSEAPENMAKKRKRRTIEELIADLEAEKVDLIARLKTQELKASPAHKLALAAIKRLDKAAALAAQEGEGDLRRALADARDKLAPYLEERGVRLPKLRKPRGPRPKDKEKE